MHFTYYRFYMLSVSQSVLVNARHRTPNGTYCLCYVLISSDTGSRVGHLFVIKQQQTVHLYFRFHWSSWSSLSKLPWGCRYVYITDAPISSCYTNWKWQPSQFTEWPAQRLCVQVQLQVSGGEVWGRFRHSSHFLHCSAARATHPTSYRISWGPKISGKSEPKPVAWMFVWVRRALPLCPGEGRFGWITTVWYCPGLYVHLPAQTPVCLLLKLHSMCTQTQTAMFSQPAMWDHIHVASTPSIASSDIPSTCTWWLANQALISTRSAWHTQQVQ